MDIIEEISTFPLLRAIFVDPMQLCDGIIGIGIQLYTGEYLEYNIPSVCGMPYTPPGYAASATSKFEIAADNGNISLIRKPGLEIICQHNDSLSHYVATNYAHYYEGPDNLIRKYIPSTQTIWTSHHMYFLHNGRVCKHATLNPTQKKPLRISYILPTVSQVSLVPIGHKRPQYVVKTESDIRKILLS